MSELTQKKSATLQLLIRLVVKNEKGEVIQDTGKMPSHSFVIQFLEFIYGLFIGVNKKATDTTNLESFIYYATGNCSAQFVADAVAAEDEWGIVVGEGAGAESNLNYKLTDQLTEGTGVGQITHGPSIVGDTGVVGANVDLELSRNFVNNTGSSLTVLEVGIYARNHQVTREHCIIRDVLGVSVVLADKCSLTVYYTLRTNVSV